VHQSGISRQVNPFKVFCTIIPAVSVDVVDRFVMALAKGFCHEAVNVESAFKTFVTELGGLVTVGVQPGAFRGLLAYNAD
jgi:hypothetical protein